MSEARKKPIRLELAGQLTLANKSDNNYAIQFKNKLLSFLSRSTSGNTREAYRRAILEFHQFTKGRLLAITEREVLAWRDSLIWAKQSNHTVAAKLSALRSFYTFLQKTNPELVAYNPADAQLVPPPRLASVLKGRALTSKEVGYLLYGPDRSKMDGARDYALMLVMLRLSLRVSEVSSMRKSFIVWKHGRWTLTLKVKGGAEEMWPLPPDVKRAIDDYLKLDALRRSYWAENRTEDQFIFQPTVNFRTGAYNRGLTRQMIANIVRKWAFYTGIKGTVTPHDLRRTAITRALNQGRTYREVQMMSKHKDPKTVMRYDYERDNLERNPVNSLDYEED